MKTDLTVADRPLPWEGRSPNEERRLRLVVAWSLDEPHRLGESILADGPLCVGRGDPLPDDPAPRAVPRRLRPGWSEPRPPFSNKRLSRVQLVLTPRGTDVIELRNVGKAVVRVNDRPITTAEVRAGDVIDIHNAMVLYVVERAANLPPASAALTEAFAFGTPDPFGIVGESEAAWAERQALAFAASTDRHVLLLGESGAGKELAARSIHGRSTRSSRPLIARNAATMPESLLDAELFGNVKNYPNPGMPERAGLVGEADGSTLFLDEIGDLPENHQVHLLRVLDADGEYQRLGEAKTKRSTFRLVAATNRSVDALKHDFLARFTHRIDVPGLPDRRDDIPLVVQALLRRVAEKNPAVAERFFERLPNGVAAPRLAPDFVVRLLRHAFTHHVRELDRLLWLAVGSAQGDFLGLTPAVEGELKESEESASVAPAEIDRDTLARALQDNGRSPSRAAKALGLKNRYVLLRLLKKHGLSASEDDA